MVRYCSPSKIVLIRRVIFLFFLSFFFEGSYAQKLLKLWEEGEKPFFKSNDLQEYEEEMWGTQCLLDITEPTLTIYEAQGNSTGKAVMIIPGGGYEMVAMYHEGYDVAQRLSEAGITAAVLKYRLPKTESSDEPHRVPLTDARRALVLLRQYTEDINLDVMEFGVVGFSAGSHLATVMGLWKSDIENENPDFSGLIYGVTTSSGSNLKWLEESLYHRKMTDQELKRNQLLRLVNNETPPAFLVHAMDDDVCLVEESLRYAEKLKANNVPHEAHYFPTGGHGFGLGRQEDGTDQWIELFINWVKRI